ncbi:MAG: chemotaxis protein CheW [Bacillota bacterium]|uniref:Chemotaxis protein CheW n=1 Tax=Thermanaerosceptrum fracticalcis TaxID=1712410 RepID=A0A7G6DZ32_THEFR|nr:chemotaxis protein CheW [Thermanaerosceptrum fracticalcis]QNB45086.1 chemotaxis protein CheW [Thermanaerosceptrum fracticalcis]
MADQQFVVFKLHTEEYGIEIKNVQEIVHMQEITRLPQSLEFVEGIINLRGRIIPVVDLKKRFYGVKTETGDNTRIIVIDLGNQVLGIMADEVSEVLRLNETMIDPPPAIIMQMSSGNGVKGIGKLEDRLLILLDLTKAFSLEEKQQIQATAG